MPYLRQCKAWAGDQCCNELAYYYQGVSPDFLTIRNWPLKSGTSFGDEDVNGAAKVCLVGQTVVDNIFDPSDDPVGKIIRFNKIPFKIIGVLSEKGENAFGQDQDDIILAPYTTVQKGY
jgi:putative ABC transport system permease protein